MEEMILNQQEVANMQGAIMQVLQGFRGVPVRVNYDLNRIKKVLDKSMAEWAKTYNGVFQKYSSQVPKYKFIPIEKYAEFKKELENYFTGGYEVEWYEAKQIMERYEVEPDTEYTNCIPTELKAKFDAEMERLIEETKTTITFNKISVIPNFIEGLKNLSGIHQVAILDLFEVIEESKIIIPELKIAPKFPGGN